VLFRRTKPVSGTAKSTGKDPDTENERDAQAGGYNMDTERILNIIRNSNGKGGIISILEEIQTEFTYLPEAALRLVAKETGRSLADIYGVATFYKAFSLKPRGRHCVSACLGTACHVRGARTIVEEFKEQLHISPGETTPDKEITFETVNCLGACALGPIVVSDEHYFANVTARGVRDIIQGTKDGTYGSNGRGHEDLFSVEVSCPTCNRSLMDKEYRLHDRPAILVNVSMNGKKGKLRISSLYGNFAEIREHDIPNNTIADLSCPRCGVNLRSGSGCVECGAPMASMKVNGGDGIMRICTRTGCNGHMLDLDGEGTQQ